jgi:hypothetical protein
MVIGPGLFQLMSHLVDGTNTPQAKHQEPRSRGTEPSNHPQYFFHNALLYETRLTEGWMQVTPMWLLDGVFFGSRERNDYTSGMDSVRFGRALGIGARHAAKALAQAADAAAAPSPSADRAPAQPATSTQPGPAEAHRPGPRLVQQAARTTVQARQTAAGVARGGKRFGEAMWEPLAKASGQLWLELTGVFFGLFVMTAGMNAWRLRANLHDTGVNHSAHQHFELSVMMAVVFGYFCISSFVRAGRKGRR